MPKARSAGPARKERGGKPRKRRSILGRLVYGAVVARHLGRDRRLRHHRLPRRAAAADRSARGAEAPAEHRDPRRRRHAARQPRRDRRAHRRDQGAAALPAEGVRRDRGPALLRPSRRRSGRHRPRADAQPHLARRRPGRLDADPAARQEPVPDPGAHRLAQDPGGDPRASGSSATTPRTRSSSSTSTGSISAPAPTASRRRRSAISASRPAR